MPKKQTFTSELEQMQSPTASATLQNIFEKAQFRRIKL